MASASPTSLQTILDRPGLDRSETKAYDGSDGKFAGLMAQFAPTAFTLPKPERAHGTSELREPAQARKADGTPPPDRSGREAAATHGNRPVSPAAPKRLARPQEDGIPAARQVPLEPRAATRAQAEPEPQVEGGPRPGIEAEARSEAEPALNQATTTTPTPDGTVAALALSAAMAPLELPGDPELAPAGLQVASTSLAEQLQPPTTSGAPQPAATASGEPKPATAPALEATAELTRVLNLAGTPRPVENQVLVETSTPGATPESAAKAPALGSPSALQLPALPLPSQAGPSQAAPVLTFQAVVAAEGNPLKGVTKPGTPRLAPPESPLLAATPGEKAAPLAAASPLLLQVSPAKAAPVAGPDALLASTLDTGAPGATLAFGATQEQALDWSGGKLSLGSAPTLNASDGASQAALAAGPRPLETPGTPGTNPPAPSSVAPTPAAKQVEGSMRWMLRTGAQEAQLQLHPDSLGQVTIHLKVEGGEVHARIWVTDPSSAQAVQEGRAHLEQSLKEQGLQLGSFDLQQGNHPSREAPATPTHASGSGIEGPQARQEAPAAPVASILNAHHVELYA